MNDQQTPSNEAAENNVDISLFGLGSITSWIVFAVLIIGGIILLPWLLNLFV